MTAATRLKKKEVECRERRCLGGEEVEVYRRAFKGSAARIGSMLGRL